MDRQGTNLVGHRQTAGPVQAERQHVTGVCEPYGCHAEAVYLVQRTLYVVEGPYSKDGVDGPVPPNACDLIEEKRIELVKRRVNANNNIANKDNLMLVLAFKLEETQYLGYN